MNNLWNSIADKLKDLLISGILANLLGLFDGVNDKISDVVVQVGKTPQMWNNSIFDMVKNLSDTVVLPIAGLILAFVMTLDLIRLVTEKNNLSDIDTWSFFKWAFKTACAILIVTNTWNIIMGVFDMSQSLVQSASGVIVSNTSIDLQTLIPDLQQQLEAMDLGPLLGLWFQSTIVGVTMWALTICIFIITYGRMIEIYLVTSLAPVPLASMMSRDSGGMGQNYLRSLFALGFQAFLIMVCIAIYAVLVHNIAVPSDISAAIWTCVGYTVLLCFTLFKTGSVSKSIFAAH